MAEDLCTIVTSEGGDRWVYIPARRRVFYNYGDGWGEAQVSWAAMTKHMHYAISEKDNQPIPADLRRIIRLQRQGKL